jgi:hypothetical protein
MLQTRRLEECHAVADPMANLLVRQVVEATGSRSHEPAAPSPVARIGSEGSGRETVSADWDRGP